MGRRRWFFLLAALGAAVLYRGLRRGPLQQSPEDWLFVSRPGAWLYDLFGGFALARFYDRVAREVVSMSPAGSVLDVGCGPGHLEVLLARRAPDLTVVGLDLSAEMIEMARRRASAAGVVERASFEVGDVAALPFPEGQFDLVVSTLSMHHWSDVDRGLAEIRRVLRPGGQACLYDLSDWMLRRSRHGVAVSASAAARAFGGEAVEMPWKLGPVPALRRLCLQRSE